MIKCEKLAIICALFVSCFSFSPCYANSTEPIELPKNQQVVMVPLPKLIELQSLISKQGPRINQLSAILSEQESTLNKQYKEINLLKQSLQSSEQIINEQNASLTKLSEERKKENRKLKTQRLIWQIVAGVVILQSLK